MTHRAPLRTTIYVQSHEPVFTTKTTASTRARSVRWRYSLCQRHSWRWLATDTKLREHEHGDRPTDTDPLRSRIAALWVASRSALPTSTLLHNTQQPAAGTLEKQHNFAPENTTRPSVKQKVGGAGCEPSRSSERSMCWSRSVEGPRVLIARPLIATPACLYTLAFKWKGAVQPRGPREKKCDRSREGSLTTRLGTQVTFLGACRVYTF